MNANNKSKKKSMKIAITMMLTLVFLIGQFFSPFATLANATSYNWNSDQTIKVIVKDAESGQRINGATVTFNGPGGSGDTYSGTSGIDGTGYIDVHNGSEKQVGVTVNKSGYSIWNVYDSNYYIRNGSYNKNLVIKGVWKDNHTINIELKKNSTDSNTTSSTNGSKPQFTVTMDSYTPTNPSVGGEITYTGTIHPQDFEIPVPAKEIVLVLDSSGSMGDNSKLTNLKAAANNFIDKMKIVKNLKIGIVDFDTEAVSGYGVDIRKYLTGYSGEAGNDGSYGSKLIDVSNDSNVTALKSAINNLNAGGGTNTGEGLRQAAYLLNTTSTASKTIVFMSDGEPTFYNWQDSNNNQSDYYTDVTTPNFGNNVSRQGEGSSDPGDKSLKYAKTMGAKIKENGYNVFSIGYGLDDSGTTKMQQIHNSMSSVSGNFFESDTDSIDSIFNSIANTILDTYPITDIKFNFNPNANPSIISVDGNTISLPDFNYKKVDSTSSSSTIKYTADPIPFTVKVKSNTVGNNIPVFTNSTSKSTVTFPWKSATGSAETISADVPTQYINIGNVDNTPPELTLTKADPINGSVEITASATDNVAVASITTPDSNIVAFTPAVTNSTKYTATMNGDYTFKATDTSGNVTTKTININNIVNTNVASKPNFTVTMDSYLPTNPGVGDVITFNGTIHPEDFQISIPEKEIVLVLDSSGSMGNNLKLYNLKIAAKNFIDKMKGVQNLKIGIVDFDTQATVKNGLTTASDVNTLNASIDSLSAGGGTNTGEGLRQAAYLLSSGSSTASKTIVFMSDGEPTYYNSKDNQYYTNITNGSIDSSVQRKGTGNSDTNGYCLDYAKAIGAIIKQNGYNTFSISYGLDASGTTKMQQIHNSMSSVSDNFFKSDTGSIDSVFNSIGNAILDTYTISDVKFNFNGGTNSNIVSVDGEIINLPNFNYTISSQTSSTVKYTAEPVPFTVKIKANREGTHMPVFTASTVTFPWKSETITGIVPEQYINVGTIISIAAPVITDPLTGTSTSNNRPTISGTGHAGYTVTVYDGTTAIGTATVDSNGNWSLTPTTALANGNHVITATQADAARNVSEASNTVNLKIVPLAPVITSPTDGTSTSNNRPTISGTGHAGYTITVYDGATTIGTVTVDSNGNWSLTPTTALANGNHVITATQADASGNTSGASNTVNLKIVPSAPVITSPTDGTITSNNRPTISGTGQAGLTVIVYDNGTQIGTAIVQSDGTWNLTLTTSLSDDTHPITAKQQDAAGNISGASNTVNIIIVTTPSIISAHGLYNGNVTNIINNGSLDVTKEIPVTMGIIVEARSSHPIIKLSWNNGTKITVDNTSFKGYYISGGTIGNPTSLSIDESGNISGLSIENGNRYLIVYTITPTANATGTITLTATADVTSSVSITLNVIGKPDLF